MTAVDDAPARVGDDPPRLWREHDPLGEVRVGPDLVVIVCAAAAGDRIARPQRLVAVALDNDGNYLSTLAVSRDRMPDPIIAAAIETARQLYPQHAGLVEYREVER